LFAFALPKTVDYYDTDSGTSLHGLSRWFFCLDFESIFLVYGGAAAALLPMIYSSSSDHDEIM